MLYYIIFVLLLVLSAVELYMYNHRITLKGGINTRLLICAFLIVLAGGRLNSGYDYGSYEQYFLLIKEGSLKISNNIVEPLYVIVNMIAPSYRVLLIIMAIAGIGIKYIAFKRLRVELFSFILFVYFSTFFLVYDMGIMRQGLSMGICLLAIPYAQRGDKRFFLIVITAMLFHISATLFLLVYFVANKEFSRNTYYCVLGASIVLAVVSCSAFFRGSIVRLIISLAGDGYISHKIIRYYSTNSTDYVLTIAKRVLIAVIFIEWFKTDKTKRTLQLEQKDRELVWTLVNGYTLSIPLFSLMALLGFGLQAGRLTSSLYILYSLVYERIVSSRRHRLIRFGLFAVFVVLCFASFRETLKNSAGEAYNSYQFFLG